MGSWGPSHSCPALLSPPTALPVPQEPPSALQGVPTVHGAVGPFPFATLLSGIQWQAWQSWGLDEDLAKPEEE